MAHRAMQMTQMTSMLKDGTQHLSGLEEAVLRNIDACKQLSRITRTSMGPNGLFFVGLPFLEFIDWVQA